MRCLECGSEAVTERPERTAQGYRRFRCRACGKQFNERSDTLLNRTQYPSDVIALVVLWRLRLRHRTSAYLNNRLEQDHRGIKGRYRSMRGFKCPRSAARFCRAYDELRNFLRLRSRHHQHVPADRRRLLHLRRSVTVLAILQAA